MLTTAALLISAIASIAAAGLYTTGPNQPTVQTKNGSYSGLYQEVYDQDLFLGIPFAQPPLGDLRFNNPAPLNSSWDGPRSATAYSPQCIGYGSDTWILGNFVSEDCLTLNVVRPGGTNESDALPVGVWIHGGGSTNGGSSDPRYNMSFIVDQGVKAGKPFISVSINYRLHAYGYIWGTAVQDAGVANLGIKDQRLALHWIQENIALFGGDPAKVTIWGESAGATSIGWQLLAYGGRDDGLFRAAILESGSPATTAFRNASSWDPYYNNITAATNCSSAGDTLACLRQVPIDVLSPILNSSVTSAATWGPVTDGDFAQNSGYGQLEAGQFVKVPVLQGRNHDEGTSWGVKGINTTAQFLAYYSTQGYNRETLPVLAAVYPDIPEIGVPATLKGRPSPDSVYGQQWKRTCAATGDIRQHAPRRYMSQIWAKNNVTNYSYHFNIFPAGVAQEIGSTHFAEVAWVFYNINGEGYRNAIAKNPFEGVPESYIQSAAIMSRMWASFIVDGTPNNSGRK